MITWAFRIAAAIAFISWAICLAKIYDDFNDAYYWSCGLSISLAVVLMYAMYDNDRRKRPERRMFTSEVFAGDVLAISTGELESIVYIYALCEPTPRWKVRGLLMPDWHRCLLTRKEVFAVAIDLDKGYNNGRVIDLIVEALQEDRSVHISGIGTADWRKSPIPMTVFASGGNGFVEIERKGLYRKVFFEL